MCHYIPLLNLHFVDGGVQSIFVSEYLFLGAEIRLKL